MSLKPKTAIVICGPHQSGAAVLSGILSKIGYSLGKNVLGIGGDGQNLLYENASVQEFFTGFIQGTGHQWLSPFVSGSKILSGANQEKKTKDLERLIESQFASESQIVLKDPRFSVCLPLVLEALYNLEYDIKVVVMLRHPHEVALSMQKKHGLSLTRSNLIYTNYLSQSEYYSRNFQRAFIHFNHLVDRPEEILSALFSSLSVNVDPANNLADGLSIISKDKIKHRSEGDNNPSYTTSKLYELFSEFKQEEKFKNSNIEEQIDKLINDFTEWQLLIKETTLKAVGKSPYFSQLFIDNGNGFSEKDSIRNTIQGRERRFEYNLSNEKLIKLRFDPINTHCIMTIESISLVFESGEEIKMDFEGNFLKKGNYYVFDTEDPIISINVPEAKQKIVKLDIKSSFVGVGKEAIKAFATSDPAPSKVAQPKDANISSLLQQLSQQNQSSLNELKVANKELLAMKDAELQKLNDDLQKLNGQLSAEKELLMKIQQEKISIEKQLLEKQKDIEKFEGDIEFYKSDIANNKMWASQKSTEFANAQKSLNQSLNQLKVERTRWRQVKNELDGKQVLISNIQKSISYRLGFGLTAPARFVANMFKSDGRPKKRKALTYSDDFFLDPFVFDWEFYKMANIDIEDECTTEEEYIKHWLESGIQDLRIASPIFTLSYYINRYEDIKAIQQNAGPKAVLAHFIKSGLKEGRQGSNAFKANQYLEYNLDLSYSLGDNNEDIARHLSLIHI